MRRKIRKEGRRLPRSITKTHYLEGGTLKHQEEKYLEELFGKGVSREDGTISQKGNQVDKVPKVLRGGEEKSSCFENTTRRIHNTKGPLCLYSILQQCLGPEEGLIYRRILGKQGDAKGE